MKRYRAIIIDFKGFVKKILLLFLAATISIASIYLIGGKMITYKNSPTDVIGESAPVFGIENKSDNNFLKNTFEGILQLVVGYLPYDCKSVICGTVPVYAAVTNGGLSVIAENNIFSVKTEAENHKEATAAVSLDIPEENRAPIKSIDASQKTADGMPIAIGNETSYGINIWDMLSQEPFFDLEGDGPIILITHTHATESYAPKGAEIYDVTASDRSEDTDRNVVAVGEKMAEVFTKHGIETIHDRVLHDAPSFNGSYAHSLNTVNEYIEKYPSIQIVLDIHRDSIVYDDNTKAKTVTEINGEKVAQLMFVVGTNENGLEHPNWRNNMKNAMWFQRAVCEKYPSLMRHINLRRERFNGHTTNASMIIEVGTSGNSLDEAIRGGAYASECIAELIKNYGNGNN